jgi:hypothetical protein
MRHRVGLVALAVVMFVSFAQAQTQTPEMSGAQLAQACAPPPTVSVTPASSVHLVGGQDTVDRWLYGTGELVVLSGGADAGLSIDQRYFLRRPVLFGGYGVDMSKVLTMAQTSGWVRIVAVNSGTAIARVEMACTGVLAGDYIEPFAEPEPVDEHAAVGEADFSSLGRVLFGQRESWIGGPGDFMMIDRGRNQGATPGARFAIYRNLRVPGLPLVSVGEGIVVSASEGRAMMKILSSRSAVESGDFVARRPVRTASSAAGRAN